MVLMVSSEILNTEVKFTKENLSPKLLAWCEISNLIAILNQSQDSTLLSIMHPDCPNVFHIHLNQIFLKFNFRKNVILLSI